MPDDKNIATTDTTSIPLTEEFKDQNYKHSLSKIDHDLYKEEDDITLPIIRIKHVSLPNKGDRWKVLADSKVVFVLEGSKLTKKERAFLHTVEGINFLLKQAKAGIKSFNALKKELKKHAP
jgi:hypothetical protein